MLTHWQASDDFDQIFQTLSNFRRALGQGFDRHDDPENAARAQLFDGGANWVVKADVPGFEQKDLQISANSEGLTITAERKEAAPDGYVVHRRERDVLQFSQSFNFPTKVDPDKVSAALADGVLTITLEKAAEHQPRRIEIKA